MKWASRCRRGYWPPLRLLLALLPLLGVLLHTAGWVRWEAVDRLDAWLQDARARLTMPRLTDPRVVIVDIDEKSLAALGPWPWRGDVLAKLVNELFDRQQAGSVGFDLVFEAPGPERAEDFARALTDRPVVLGYRFGQEGGSAAVGVLPRPVLSADQLAGHPVRVLERTSYTANVDRLARAAPVAGFLDMVSDPDGRVRGVPLLIKHQGNYHEAFALAIFRTMSGNPSIEPVFPAAARDPSRPHGVESLQLRQGADSVVVPVSQGVMAQVPLRPAGRAFRHVSAADLVAGRVPAGQLQGKAVLVGLTAPRLGEVIATPVADAYPRVELQASLLSGLLDERLPVRPDAASGDGLLVLGGLGLLLALVLPLLSVSRAVALYGVVMAGILGLNLWLFLAADLVLSLAPALLMTTATFALSLGYGHWVAHCARRELSALLGRYVPPELVRALVRNPRLDPARATSRPLTVLFCDLRGFTGLVERMEPRAVQVLLNRVFNRLTDVIRAHGGTIDKYMGDCVMAFWGAPLEMHDHARRAVEAALGLSRAVDALNEEHRQQGLPVLSVGIGVNTGQMCVGDMGSRLRRTYTVVGDAVNLAARLVGLSAVYGVVVLVGENTRRSTDDFIWQELDTVCVKGRTQAVTLFAPLAAGFEEDMAVAQELRIWAAFLKAYRSQDGLSCEQILAALVRRHPDKPLYALYADRLAQRRGRSPDPCEDDAPATGTL